MAENEIVKQVTDLVLQDESGKILKYTYDTIRNAGGFVLSKGTDVVLGILVTRTMTGFFERFKRAKEAGQVDENYEQTSHGATLLQEALRAMSEGLDEQRSEAVQDVFLGLAQTPPKDAIEQVLQIEVMQVAASLTTREVFMLNAIERFRKSVFDPIQAELWSRADDVDSKLMLNAPTDHHYMFDQWCQSTFSLSSQNYLRLVTAQQTLAEKGITSDINFASSTVYNRCMYDPNAGYTDFGRLLVVHLYSATDATEEMP